MCFRTRLIGGIGLVAAVVIVGGCASPTPIPRTPASTVAVPATTDPATSRNYTDLGVGPYRTRANLQVGDSARSIAVDSGLHRAYVTKSDHSLDIIDTRTLAHLDTIELDKKLFAIRPQSITIDPVTHLVYLIGQGPAEVLVVIDPATNTVTAQVPTAEDNDHSAVVVDSVRHIVYVSNSYYRTVVAIDTRNHAVLATIPVGGRPSAMAVDPGTQHLWVANGSDVSVIDPATFTVTATYPVGERPSGIAIDPETRTVFVTDYSGTALTFVDIATRTVGTIPLNQEPAIQAVVDPATHTVFVTSGAFGSITMIDTKTRKVTASRLTPSEPPYGRNTWGIAVDLATHEIFVTHGEHSRTIDVLTPV